VIEQRIIAAVTAGVLGLLVQRLPAVQPADGAEVTVSHEVEPRRFSEPHLVVHPDRPNHLLAAAWSALTAESNDQDRRCSSFVSIDSGSTWSRHDFALSNCYDAQVAIVPGGGAVFVALATVPNILPERPDWLVVFYSRDGGLTWNDTPTVLGFRHDHSSVVADLSTSPRRGWLYMTTHLEWADGTAERKSAVVITRSRDGGRTFDIPTLVTPSAEHNSAETPIVLSDGSLVVSFQEYAWQGTTARRKLWIMRSTNGGVTFDAPHLINDECGPPPGFQLTSLAVDPSLGQTQDRLYAACRRSDGGPVVVAASADRGNSWTRGVVAGPAAIARDGRRVVSLSVSTSGVVGAMIVERRNDAAAGCHSVTVSLSHDAGVTFDAPRLIASAPCGTSPNDQRAERRFPTYGDYFGIAGTADGRLHLMWPEMRSGGSVLLTTAIDVARP